DDPKLTVRMVEGRNPYRIILDSKLNLSPELNVFKKNKDKKTILVTLDDNASKKSKIKKLEQLGVKIIFVKKNHSGRVHLKSMLKEFGKMGIASILVEGGAKIFSSFVKQNLFDDLLLFVSPKILGSGIKIFSDLSYNSLQSALTLNLKKSVMIGEDILLHFIK
ncbi:MAG: RibD family protein, partial [Ignavibacteria bacterium]|nr:RibD family protein [Ignavibacteria bacterium]